MNRKRCGVVIACVLVPLIASCMSRAPAGPAAGSPAPAASPPSRGLPQVPASAASPSAGPAATVAARLNPASSDGRGASAQCLAQIEAFAELHTGSRVLLGPAAFAEGDQLVLTRMPRRGADGRPLDGRAALPQPVVLKLLTGGPNGCLLQRAAAPAGAQAPTAPLPACSCTALAR